MSSPTMDTLTMLDTEESSSNKETEREDSTYSFYTLPSSPVMVGISPTDISDDAYCFEPTAPTPNIDMADHNGSNGSIAKSNVANSTRKRPVRKAKSEAMDKCFAQNYHSPKKVRRRSNSLSCPASDEEAVNEGMSLSQRELMNESKKTEAKRKCKASGTGRKMSTKVTQSKHAGNILTSENDSKLLLENDIVVSSKPTPTKERKKTALDTSWIDIEENSYLDIDRASNESITNSQKTYSVVSSDSEGEELPDMLSTSDMADGIDRGQLVWVKYRSYPHWPAIVKTVYKQKKMTKKLTVVFIGDIQSCIGHQCLRIGYRKQNVRPFTGQGHEQYNNIKQAGLQSEYAKEFTKAVTHAESYLFKKAQDDEITVFEHFASLFKSVKASTIEAPESVMPELETTLLDKTITKTTTDTDSNSDVPSEETNQNSPEYTQATRERIEKRTLQTRKLVDFIKEEKCKNYLAEIFQGKLPCERHDLFFQKKKSKAETNVLKLSGYGPIDNETQRVEILCILHGYTNDWIKKGTEVNALNLTDYCLSVLAPEAIIYAMQRVHRVSYELAEGRFNRGVHLFKEEQIHLGRQFDRQTKAEGDNVSSDSDMEN